MLKKFGQLYNKKIEARGLGVFRIVYFIAFFFEVLQLFYYKPLLFDPVAYKEAFIINLGWPLGLWLICIFFLILGSMTALMTVLNYIFSILFFSSLSAIDYSPAYFYLSVNFLCLFLPISKMVSVDCWWLKLKYSTTRFHYKPPNQTTVLSYYIPIFFGLGFTYWGLFLNQFPNGGLWIWKLAHNLKYSTLSTSSPAYFLFNTKILILILGWISLAFFVSFPFLFSYRKLRGYLFLIGWGLQFLALLYNPNTAWLWALMALHLLLIPLAWWRALGGIFHSSKRPARLVVYYDEECPLCTRLKLSIEHFDLFSTVRFEGVQSAREDEAIKHIPLNALLDNIHASDYRGKLHVGIDAYIQIFDAMRYLLPLSLILRLPIIYQLSRRGYRYVAKNRETKPCTEDTCAYELPQLPKDTDKIKLLRTLTLGAIRLRLLFYGSLLLVLWQGLLWIDSTALKELRSKSGRLNQAYQQIVNPLKQMGKVYLGLGATFYQNQATTTWTVGISYENEKNQWAYLPLVNQDGTLGTYARGLTGAKWINLLRDAKNQVAFRNYLLAIVLFWERENRMTGQSKEYLLKIKALKPPPHSFRFNYMREQYATEWKTLGTIQKMNGELVVLLNANDKHLF